MAQEKSSRKKIPDLGMREGAREVVLMTVVAVAIWMSE